MSYADIVKALKLYRWARNRAHNGFSYDDIPDKFKPDNRNAFKSMVNAMVAAGVAIRKYPDSDAYYVTD